MEFDPRVLETLLSLDDASLWSAVCRMAEKNGITLPPGSPPVAEMQRLRESLSRKSAADVKEAARILREVQAARKKQ